MALRMTEAQLIWIDGPLPDLNQVITAAKSHWAKYHTLKREWTDIVAWTCFKQRIRPLKKVFLDITWVEKNKKRDQDNIAFAKKFILDGLQAAGVIPDDGWKNVEGWTEKFKVDKAMPGVQIKINEVCV